MHSKWVDYGLSFIIVKQTKAWVCAINRRQSWVKYHVIKDEVLDRLVLPLLMQLDVWVQLGDGQKIWNITSVESEVSVVVMACDLNDNFVCIADYYTQEFLSIFIIFGICPLWSQPSLKLYTKVYVARKNEFPIRFRVPQLILYPLKLIIKLGSLFCCTNIFVKVHDSIQC